MVYGKSDKGIPPLRISKLSKKAQDNQYGIKKRLYEGNKWWNYWRFQLNPHKIEWVNTRSKIKRNKPYSVSSNKFYLNTGDINSHWVGHSDLKELDTTEFLLKTQIIEDMEAELTES